MATLQEVTLSSAKGRPTVEIIFGNGHVGVYRSFLWDSAGKVHQEVARGETEFATFDVDVEPTDLNARILSVESIVQAAGPSAGQHYSVTVTIRQDGSVCPGGVVQESGVFDDVKALAAFRRFKTV